MSIFSSSAPQKSMLGEMLVRKNLISRDQLTEALLRQKVTSEKLGAVVVSMGLLNEKQLARALTRQKSYRYALALAAILTAPFAPAMAASSTSPTASTSSAATSNLAPVISGTPAATVSEGASYYFRPTAYDPEGKTLYFKIKNKPAWAVFNSKTGTLSGKPTTTNIGTYNSIQISASDGNKISYMNPFSISVNPIEKVTLNQIPIAASANFSTNSGTSVSGTLAASDPNGDPLVFSISTGAIHGTLNITNASTGAFIYTPTAGYVGTDSFIFRATDIHGASATAPVSINVISVNTAPVAGDSSEAVAEDSSVSGLVNASDADGQALTFGVTRNVTHGSLAFNPSSGAYTYNPTPNFSGTDSFQYSVQDSSGAAASAQVTFTVSSVNDAPVARAGAFAGTEDTALTGNLTATDIDGDALSFSISGSAAHGTLTITNAATGSFSYTPALNYTGTDSFTFLVSDGRGGQSTAQASINITGVNDVPTATNASFQVNEDRTLSGQVTGSDPDGSSLTYRLMTTAGHGTVSLNSSNGSFTFTPAPNYNGPDTFSFQVTDVQGSTASAQVSVAVLSVDDVPIAAGDNASTSTNTPVTIAVLNNDTNLGDGGIQVSIANAPGHGTASVSNNQVIYTPANNYSGSDSISYRITDADGDTSVATIAITATCTQNCPANVTLSWSAPTTRADGTALTNLAGYLVHYGSSRATYTNSVDVSGATSLTHTLQSLPAGTYYFSVTAYDASGAESGYSTEVTRTIN